LSYKLKDVCSYAKDRIALSNLTIKTYISTENMLSEKGGVVVASGLPTTPQVAKYQPSDVLISNIRPYFKKIWYANKTGGCSNDVLVVRSNEKYDSLFLYYVLSNDEFFSYSTATAKGTKMPRGDKTAIMDYGVPNIPLAQQKKIGKLLSSFDRKIQQNNKINDYLEQMTFAYYRHLFVDNASSDWSIGTIADLGAIVGGSTPSKAKSEYYTIDGIAWITPKDLSNNKSKFIRRGEIDITPLGLKNSSAKIMPKGSILFSSRAPIGYIAISNGEVTTNQGFKSILPKANIGTAYVYYFLKDNLVIIESMASGSTFMEVSGSTMKVVPALIPDDHTLSQFNNFCNELFEQQEQLESENVRLESIRDVLLPKLMSGEVSVTDL